MAYVRRTVDAQLDEYLAGVAAVSLEGPRGVGKTTTAARRAGTIYTLDDATSRELLDSDPGRIARDSGPVLLDEWQLKPEMWDVVRRAVDAGSPAGAFLLTGSAQPAVGPAHSGAGRIVEVRMRPMAFHERGLAEPTVSLGELLKNPEAEVDGATDVGVDQYIDEIVASGFPVIRNVIPELRSNALASYLDRACSRDIVDAGFPAPNRAGMGRWLAAYSAAISTTANYESIRDAASPGQQTKPAKTTTLRWRDVLESTWLLEPVPAWVSPFDNPIRRLAETPKTQVCDPAIAASIHGLSEMRLRRGSMLLGPLFESLTTLSIRVCAQAHEARVSHLRTRGGEHEVDLVVEDREGRLAAIPFN